MAINSVRCPVLGAHVPRVTNLEGETTRIMCAEYDEATGICRLKSNGTQGGMLSQFLERMSEDALSTKDTHCVLRFG